MAASLQSKIDRAIQDLSEKYCKYVRNNPQTCSQVESTIRVLSFLVAGRFENGPVLSELIYSTSNLLVLLNDHVIKAAAKFFPKLDQEKERLKQWLTMLEYIEVFLEMAVYKKWGNTGSWIIITVIQITKTVLRLYMLLSQKAGIQSTPPIEVLDREAVSKIDESEQHDKLEDVLGEEDEESTPTDGTFTLPSSGRQIRRLKASPANNQRVWNLPKETANIPVPSRAETKRKQMLIKATTLTKKRTWAECLHIVRPIAHLCGMYTFGRSSWKPWLLACGMDVSSICLMGDTSELNSREKWELKRRSLMLLYYILRSPFYDKFSKTRILLLLRYLADRIPGMRLLFNPLIAYLPDWQKRYFYVWTT